MIGSLAERMFDAAERERVLHDDSHEPCLPEGLDTSRIPRRWTEIPEVERLCWEAAERVARKQVALEIMDGIVEGTKLAASVLRGEATGDVMQRAQGCVDHAAQMLRAREVTP